MLRFLAQTAIALVANAIGLLVAAWVLQGFEIQPLGFIVSVGLFTIVEVLFEPFIISMSLRYMPALRGGIALVTTLVGLIAVTMFTDGVSISGLNTWVLAPLIIWLTVLFASVILPMFFFKQTLEGKTDDRADKASDAANL